MQPAWAGAWAPMCLITSVPHWWFRWSAVPRDSRPKYAFVSTNPAARPPHPIPSASRELRAPLTPPPCCPHVSPAPTCSETTVLHAGVASSGWVRWAPASASRDVRAGPLSLDCPLTCPEWSFSPRSVLASSLTPSFLPVTHPAPWPPWPPPWAPAGVCSLLGCPLTPWRPWAPRLGQWPADLMSLDFLPQLVFSHL